MSLARIWDHGPAILTLSGLGCYLVLLALGAIAGIVPPHPLSITVMVMGAVAAAGVAWMYLRVPDEEDGAGGDWE